MYKFQQYLLTLVLFFLGGLPTVYGVSQSLNNPLTFNNEDDNNGLADFITALLDIVLVIAVPFLVFFLILAGFYYVTARGNPEKIQAANKALLYAAIGIVIVLGAGAIAVIVENTVNSFNQ